MRKRNSFGAGVVALGIMLLLMSPVKALSEEFFDGKTIRFIVGYAPGGGYDTYTRAVARYIAKHIPGNPTPVVQNMTGAGSLIAANYTYNRAKPDGLNIGIWNNGLVLQQALGGRGVNFDARKFGWIGAPVRGWPTCAIMGFTGLKNAEDVLNYKKPIRLGATRSGSTTNDMPKILNTTLGTNFEVISGFRGTATIRLAMQKRELHGACWGWESMSVTARPMLDAKGDDRLIPYMIHGEIDDPDVKNLPQVTDLVKGESNLAIFKGWSTVYEFQRPLSLPPGTPKDRVETLRRAYKATLHDPEFLAEAKKMDLIIHYVSGQEIEKFVDQILATPPAAKEALEFLAHGKK